MNELKIWYEILIIKWEQNVIQYETIPMNNGKLFSSKFRIKIRLVIAQLVRQQNKFLVIIPYNSDKMQFK